MKNKKLLPGKKKGNKVYNDIDWYTDFNSLVKEKKSKTYIPKCQKPGDFGTYHTVKHKRLLSLLLLMSIFFSKKNICLNILLTPSKHRVCVLTLCKHSRVKNYIHIHIRRELNTPYKLYKYNKMTRRKKKLDRNIIVYFF